MAGASRSHALRPNRVAARYRRAFPLHPTTTCRRVARGEAVEESTTRRFQQVHARCGRNVQYIAEALSRPLCSPVLDRSGPSPLQPARSAGSAAHLGTGTLPQIGSAPCGSAPRAEAGRMRWCCPSQSPALPDREPREPVGMATQNQRGGIQQPEQQERDPGRVRPRTNTKAPVRSPGREPLHALCCSTSLLVPLQQVDHDSGDHHAHQEIPAQECAFTPASSR